MPRGKKDSEKPKPGREKPKPGSKKPAAEPPRGVDLAAEEKKLRDAYPDQKIVKGSLRDAGSVPEFGNKRTVEIHCQRTNKVFRIATSDLHQVKYCKEAIKEIRLERRKEQRKERHAQRKPAKATGKQPAKKAVKVANQSPPPEPVTSAQD